MKDFWIGFLSGLLLTIGMVLWLGQFYFIGIILILISQFLTVVVFGHYMYLKKNK